MNIDTRRLYGLVAIRDYTLAEIQAAKPSDGWTMRNIQDQAAKEFPLWEEEYVQSEVKRVVLKYCNQQENKVRTKIKALGANVYRVRKDLKRYKVYFTARGIVLTFHKAYWYWNTGLPFHKKALAVTDIQGDESVETKYTRPAWKIYSKEITYRRQQRKAA